jgi:hypothetical protein
MRVLACLQANRAKIGAACNRPVLHQCGAMIYQGIEYQVRASLGGTMGVADLLSRQG